MSSVISLVKPYIAPKAEMMPALEEILYSGYIAEGEAVYSFERELGQYLDGSCALALQSGTAALHIALLMHGIGPGDEVISTALTAEPTNTTIALTGAKIVWADVDSSTGLIDIDSVRQKVSERTKAVMLVHYAGMVCDMDAFYAFSKETGIPLIEDAAHALGARYDGRRVGFGSRFTCYSFQAIKHLTTVDGGAIALKEPSDAEGVRRLRWFGLDKRVSRLENDITRAGYKYGMNNVNATIGSVQLKHMDDVIGRHIANGKYFDEKLADVAGVTQVKYYTNTEPSYWLYTMKVERRADFISMMAEEGIEASQLHHRNDTHSVFAPSRCELPALDRFCAEYVHIPCGWWVDDDERERIVQTIKKGW